MNPYSIASHILAHLIIAVTMLIEYSISNSFIGLFPFGLTVPIYSTTKRRTTELEFVLL